jgi:hypothetical protein
MNGNATRVPHAAPQMDVRTPAERTNQATKKKTKKGGNNRNHKSRSEQRWSDWYALHARLRGGGGRLVPRGGG